MPTSDVDSLLRALLPALLPAFSLSLSGCTASGSDISGVSSATTASASSATSASAVALPKTTPPNSRPEIAEIEEGPTCPTASWCGPRNAATKLARAGSGEVSACPSDIGAPLRSSGNELPGEPGQGRPPAEVQAFKELLSSDPLYDQLLLAENGYRFRLDVGLTTGKVSAGELVCCYTWTEQCPGGRPFLDAHAQPVHAALRPGTAWHPPRIVVELPTELTAQAARLWLADAAMEHASVASFGRVALELMALGAPPELLEATHHAALDEIRHAKTCFAIASACGARAVEPGHMPVDGPRQPNFGRLAADTFVEGCVGETTAALVLQRAANSCASTQLAQHLLGMSTDESAHAALAWRTVHWAVQRGGAEALRQLRTRAELFEAQLHARALPQDCTDEQGLAAAGRLDRMEQRKARHDAWFGVVKPMLSVLLDKTMRLT